MATSRSTELARSILDRIICHRDVTPNHSHFRPRDRQYHDGIRNRDNIEKALVSAFDATLNHAAIQKMSQHNYNLLYEILIQSLITGGNKYLVNYKLDSREKNLNWPRDKGIIFVCTVDKGETRWVADYYNDAFAYFAEDFYCNPNNIANKINYDLQGFFSSVLIKPMHSSSNSNTFTIKPQTKEVGTQTDEVKEAENNIEEQNQIINKRTRLN